MLESRTPRVISDRRVDDVVDVAAKGIGIDSGKPCPPLAQLVERNTRPTETDQQRDLGSGSGDGQSFAALGPFHDVASVVAKVTDGPKR